MMFISVCILCTCTVQNNVMSHAWVTENNRAIHVLYTILPAKSNSDVVFVYTCLVNH